MNKGLKGFRAEYGLLQTDMAKVLSVSNASYSKKERYYTFKQKEMQTITDYVNEVSTNRIYTVDDLFFTQ